MNFVSVFETVASRLAYGDCTEAQQQALGKMLAEVLPDARRAYNTVTELYREDQEQALLDRRAQTRCADVRQFPVRDGRP